MNKSKIIKWQYVTKRIDEYVYPGDVHRVHKPLEPSLSHSSSFLYLRACVQGVDKNGTVVKYLYCTRDGRFFVHNADGWYEVLPSNMTHPRNNAHCGGAFDSPSMSHFGHKYCHRCVAFAWLDRPVDLQAQLMRLPSDTKWEVDHLNGDHKNWTADNLEWVTDYENRRRAGIMRRMRKIGLDPKLLTGSQLRCIYSLIEKTVNLVNMPENLVDYFLNLFQGYCAIDPSPLSVEQIRKNTDYALLRIIRGLEAEGLDAISKQYEKILNPNYQSL